MVVEPVELDLQEPVGLVLELEEAAVGPAQVPEAENRVAAAGGEGVELVGVVVEVRDRI